MSTRGGKLPMLKHNYRLQLTNRQSLIEQLKLKVADLEKAVRQSQEERSQMLEQHETELNTIRDQLGMTVAELQHTQSDLATEKEQSRIRGNAIQTLELQLKMEKENFHTTSEKLKASQEQVDMLQTELKTQKQWAEGAVLRLKALLRETEESIEDMESYI